MLGQLPSISLVTSTTVLMLLPPSETKIAGGGGPPLDVERLSFPELNPTRTRLLDALVSLAADLPASLRALGISERQSHEVARNASVYESPTMPALSRYTGVLYEALDPGSLSAPERGRARERLAVASALFGIVRADDPIPAYRLSAGSAVPGVGSLRTLWRPVLGPALADRDELVVDLRSGAYTALTPVPQAVTVRVVTERADGTRATVSHHNKAYKGRLARALIGESREPDGPADIVVAAKKAGLGVEQTGDRTLDLVVIA